MTNAFDSMDLNTAYEIAGGYIEADDEIFAKALGKPPAKPKFLSKPNRTKKKKSQPVPKKFWTTPRF